MKRSHKQSHVTEHIESDDGDVSDIDNSMSELLTGQKQRQKKQKAVIIDPYANETAEQKRVRLAKEYIASVGLDIDNDEEEEKLVEDDDDENIISSAYGNDALAKLLKEQALRLQGREKRVSIVETINLSKIQSKLSISSTLSHLQQQQQYQQHQNLPKISPSQLPVHNISPLWIKHDHRWTITALVLSDDGTIAVTASQDGSIIKYELETGKRIIISRGTAKKGTGHKGAIYSLSLSSDNVFLASGGADSSVRIWNLQTNECVHKFTRHRGVVRGVKFKRDSLSLFSVGDDRLVCLYDIEQMNFMETLYGHTKPIMAVEALYQDRVFTCGSDATCRLWKLETESQLVFEGKKDVLSYDCLTLFDHDTIITGGQNNTVSLWSSKKRKPCDVVHNAHSSQSFAHLGTTKYGPTVQTLSHPVENWITAMHALYCTDLLITGSSDGYLRFWKVDIRQQNITQLFAIPILGYINGIQIGANGRFVLVAVGKNNRLGSWTGHITSNVYEGLYCYDLSSLYDEIKPESNQ